MISMDDLDFLSGPTYQAIGPVEAKWLLANNTFNRTPSKATVARYADDMREGRWVKTSQTISFWYDQENDKIVLLNGQQRLMAVIESGCTIVFLLAPEDTKDVFASTDIGRPRTAQALMKMDGYTNVTARRATVAAAINYDRWKGTKTPWHRTGIAYPEIRQWLKALPPQKMARLDEVLLQYQTARRRIRVTDTWYSSLAWLVAEHSEHSSRWLMFHEGYMTSEGLYKDSPIAALQRYTINRKADSGSKAQTAWDRQVHVAIGIKAWNDWVVGDTAQYYKFLKTSLPMPEIL